MKQQLLPTLPKQTLDHFYDPKDACLSSYHQWLNQEAFFHCHIRGDHLSGKSHLLMAALTQIPLSDNVIVLRKHHPDPYHMDDLLSADWLLIDDLIDWLKKHNEATFIAIYNARLSQKKPFLTTLDDTLAPTTADVHSRLASAWLLHTPVFSSESDLFNLRNSIAARYGYALPDNVHKRYAHRLARRASDHITHLQNYLQFLGEKQRNPSIHSWHLFQTEVGDS